jgi:hypothetical protein
MLYTNYLRIQIITISTSFHYTIFNTNYKTIELKTICFFFEGMNPLRLQEIINTYSLG